MPNRDGLFAVIAGPARQRRVPVIPISTAKARRVSLPNRDGRDKAGHELEQESDFR
jgi:hypothetical protein